MACAIVSEVVVYTPEKDGRLPGILSRESHFVGVLVKRALLFGVHIRAPDSGNSHLELLQFPSLFKLVAPQVRAW